VFTEELLSEMRKKIREKPYLTKHIRQDEMEQFITLLTSVGELLKPITEEIPAVTRDKKDDYLLAYGMVGECDYLVTGDISKRYRWLRLACVASREDEYGLGPKKDSSGL
jgi:putative PIN family toxin of toxin-antitoxin system